MKYLALTDEDHEWLQGFVLRIRKKMYAHASEYSVEQNAQIERVVEAFNGASSTPARDDSPAEEAQSESGKRGSKAASSRKSRRGEAPVLGRDACREHPKYSATRVPRTDCESCWGYYKALHPTAYPQAVLKFQREQRRRARAKA